MPSFGTLKADTLTHSTAGSLATNYVVNGSAKAWAETVNSLHVFRQLQLFIFRIRNRQFTSAFTNRWSMQVTGWHT